MFQKRGPERTAVDDRRLAGFLSFIAGAVNAAGFVVIGSFTSHVTGNIGRFADRLAAGEGGRAAIVAGAAIAFFLGAVAASMAIESNLLGRMSWISATLLFTEASLLVGFAVWAPAPGEAPAMLLGAAMGIQNSLVTRLSGAVVRTTHLTGVVTDLGIEVALWLRYVRARIGAARNVRLTLGPAAAPRPDPRKVTLLGTICAAFVVGSIVGALLALRLGRLAFVPIASSLVVAAVYALRAGLSVVHREP